MPQDSGIPIFREAGEAIGNIGRKVFRRRKTRQAEEAIERWSKLLPLPTLSMDGQGCDSACEVIDASYRVVTNDEGDAAGLARDCAERGMKGA